MEGAVKFFLDGIDFGGEGGGVVFPGVDFDGTGDAVAVLGEVVVALLDDGHDLWPGPFDAGSEGSEFIGQAGLIDDVECASDVRGDGFAFVHGKDAEFGQDHEWFLCWWLVVGGQSLEMYYRREVGQARV